MAKDKINPNPYLISFQNDVNRLMDFYSSDRKFWQDKNCINSGGCVGHEQGLWFWAQAAMILANYQEITGDTRYWGALKDSYTANWDYIINAKFYDDRLWWALTLIKVYEVNKDPDALAKAKALVMSVVNEGHQDVCYGSGGIYWDKDKTQVGSIANTLLITASGRLYLLTHDVTYKAIANKTWIWLTRSGLLASDYTLADNYQIKDNKCGTLYNWHFTYNSGILMSALSTLAQVNHQAKLAFLAKNVAQKSLYAYSKGGVIEEICTNAYACAEDKFMFKGIFVYNLATLAKASHDKRFTENIRSEMANNYDILSDRESGAVIYGFNWSLPVNFERDSSLYNPADVVSHLSAIYLELANVLLN